MGPRHFLLMAGASHECYVATPTTKAAPMRPTQHRSQAAFRIPATLLAAFVGLVMVGSTTPASAARIPEPSNVPVVPQAGHSLSAFKKKCAKKRKKKCKRRYSPAPAPAPAPTVSSHWIRDVDGNGTLEVTFDTNSDGIYETVCYDLDQDGYTETVYTSSALGTAAAMDVNRDTYYEYIFIDAASDGWWDSGYYDGNADGYFDAVGYDVNPVDNVMDSWYTLQQPVDGSVSPIVNENIVTMNLIRTQDPWAYQDPWGTWAGGASNNPPY